MPASVPLVRLNQTLPVCSFLSSIGAPVERFLREAGLPVHALGDPNALASAHLIYDFVGRAARSEGIEDLGWQAGIATRAAELGELGAAFAPSTSAACLGEALMQSFARVGHESRRTQLWMQRHGGDVRLCYSGSVDTQGFGFPLVEQYMVGLLVMMVREAAGPSWVPTEIHVRAQGPSALEHVECLADVRVRTGAAVTAIGVSFATLRMPLRVSGWGMRPAPCPPVAMGPQPDQGLPTGFCESITGVLRPYLSEGTPGIELAARLANTSVRSLQRLLAESGKSFSQVVDELRLETALKLLADDSNRLADVAYDLGYSDPAHLTRAFRRWTGMAPSAYRRSVLGQAS